MSERVEDPRSAVYREPSLGGDGLPHDWRLVTNFTRPAEIARSFGAWPDDVLSFKTLQAFYEGKSSEAIPRLSVKVEGKALPSFPFLDEVEGSAISALIGAHKTGLYEPFRSGLASLGSRSRPAADAALVVLQPLLVLTLRKLEQETGLWEKRSPVQKSGTVFALRPDSDVSFVRVNAFVGHRDERVGFPWGGPYREYGKILQLMESRYTDVVLESALENLEVIPEGHVIKKMQYAGLVREDNRGFLGSRWVLALPVAGYADVRDAIPQLSQVVQGIREASAEVLPKLPDLMRSGRYWYLEGHGDYMEMAYSVLLGLLCEWAMDDGVLERPPSFRVTDEGVFVHRSAAERLLGEYPPLPGIAILKDAAVIWDWIVSHAKCLR